ncbi:ROK family transcriptional regulator [Luteococcus sp. OSA5]|uniref:ROK family transcriptional regulator n=1 Tax=Luteococcus sp. OSA5 TaxID=3401630 RepID=UPI003B431249
MNDFAGLDSTTQRVALAVLRHGPVSRAELRQLLGLSAPSLTRLTKPLVSRGLLVECEPVAQQVSGRPSVPLEVNAASTHVIGAKFVADALYAVVTDLKGSVVDSAVVQRPFPTPQEAADALAELAQGWQQDWHPAGLGVSLGANVGSDGTINRVSFLGWPSTPFGEILEQTTGLDTVVANDVHAFTLAEHWFGFGRGVTDFAVATLGAGVGVGLVCGDELVTGLGGAAGRVGDVTLDDGRRLRDVAVTETIEQRASHALGRDLSVCDLPELVHEPRIQVILDDVARAIGQLVGQVCLFTAPERVLISGEGAVLLENHERALHEGIARYARLPHDRLGIESLGFDEWARGSAAMAIRAYMTPRE